MGMTLQGEVYSMAERQGFEPWVQKTVQRFSRPSLSTAQASLHDRGLYHTAIYFLHMHHYDYLLHARVRIYIYYPLVRTYLSLQNIHYYYLN